MHGAPHIYTRFLHNRINGSYLNGYYLLKFKMLLCSLFISLVSGLNIPSTVQTGGIGTGSVTSVGAAAAAHPAPFGTFGLPLEYLIGLSVGIDTVGLSKMIMDLRQIARNRESFIMDAMYKSMYAGHGNYSVLVFDLQQKYRWDDEPAVDNTLYTSVTYGRNVFGIWIFQDSAKFQNFGEDNAKHWAYYGRIKKYGGNLTFYNII